MGSEWEAAPLGLWKEMGGTNQHPPPQLPPGSHVLHHLWKWVSTHEAEAGNSAFWLYKEYTQVGKSCQAAAGSTIFHSWPPGPHWPAQLLLAFLTFGSNTSPPSSLQTFIKAYWLGLLSQEPGNLGSSPVLKKAQRCVLFVMVYSAHNPVCSFQDDGHLLILYAPERTHYIHLQFC